MQAPALARGFVQSSLCREHAQAAEAVVTLLTDELVTQALLYGAPPVTVTLTCTTTEVTVEVADCSPEPAAPSSPDQRLSMLLVDKISHDRGVERTGAGKVAWCKVPSGAIPRMRSPMPWAQTGTDAGRRAEPTRSRQSGIRF
jgi:hypothetical protein